MSEAVALRPATDADLDALRALYVDAIETAGPEAYTPEQVATWTRGAENEARFRKHLLGEAAILAADADGVLGFAALDGDRVCGLYVRGDAQRRGLGDRLLTAIVAEARARGVARLRAEASAFSVDLFERHGFGLTETEQIVRGGVAFDRHLVARDL